MAATRKKTSAKKIPLVPLSDLYERADHPMMFGGPKQEKSSLETARD